MNNQSKLIYMNKSRKYRLRAMSWLLFMSLLLVGCSSDSGDIPWLGEEEEGEFTDVVVTFSAGNSSTVTRAPFEDGTPIKLFVYRRASGGGMNYSTTPYKIVEGRTDNSPGATLSNVTFTGGDITSEGKLTVRTNSTYDFVVLANATPGATFAEFGSLSSGMLMGLTHGRDLLSGRAEGIEAVVGKKNINVTFTEGGADNGLLPHLCSAVCVEAGVTSEFFNHFTEGGGKTLTYAVDGIDFNVCLPKSANLIFLGNPMALSILASGYNTSYSAYIPSGAVTIAKDNDVAKSEEGVVLPYPLRYPERNHNLLDIEFILRVNGAIVYFKAPGVESPAFEPGYRYRFVVKMDYNEHSGDEMHLYLVVQPWDSVSWSSGMGEGKDYDPESDVVFSLGSWSSITWESGMGAGGDDGDMIITSVAGWRAISWSSVMGN